MREIIKKLRKQAGLTQKQLAEKAGVCLGCVAFYENGRGDICLNSLIKILNALNCFLIVADKKHILDLENGKLKNSMPKDN